MKCPLIFSVLMLINPVIRAQEDLAVNDVERFSFVPGLYLSFNDFIHNVPIDFDHVEGDLQEFFENPMNSKKLTITSNDSVFQVEQAATWGYSDGKRVFLNRSLFKGMNINTVGLKMEVDPWVKIHTIGTLSFVYYLTSIKINSGQLPTQSFNNTSESKLILSARDGHFYDGNLKELKFLIADDPELLEEFEKARGDKEVKFYTYIRKYNERHPIKFL